MRYERAVDVCYKDTLASNDVNSDLNDRCGRRSSISPSPSATVTVAAAAAAYTTYGMCTCARDRVVLCIIVDVYPYIQCALGCSIWRDDCRKRAARRRHARSGVRPIRIARKRFIIARTTYIGRLGASTWHVIRRRFLRSYFHERMFSRKLQFSMIFR